MNSKERVKLAFDHQEPDRVPIYELSIDNPTAAYVLGRPTLCGFGGYVRGVQQNQAIVNGTFNQYTEQRVQDLIELWNKLDLDVFPQAIPVPRNPQIPIVVDDFHWKFESPEFDQWSLYGYSPRADTYDEIDSSLNQGGLAELLRVTEILEDTDPDLGEWDFSPVDIFVRELGQDRFVMGQIDVEIGSTYCWAEHFLIGLLQEPDLIHRYLDARLKHALVVAEETLKRGVDGMEGGYDWAYNQGPMFSPKLFEEFVFPRLKKITDLCHKYGVPYVKHSDGNVNSLLDGMVKAGVDGFQAIEPRAGMDIVQLKKDYGDQLTLIGNVDCSTVLVNGPENAVREQTEMIIKKVGPGGGFLLSSSNSIHPGVKPEYYLAMLDAARQFGKYPLQ